MEQKEKSRGKVLTEIALEGCPETRIFDPNDEDWSVEDQFFPGWECPLASIARGKPSNMRVVHEGGRPVVYHHALRDRPLVTGDFLWEDYTIEAYIRQLNATSRPDNDDPHRFTGRTGLMLRYRNLRQYYYFCIEGYDRVVLYRREHAHYHILDQAVVPVDRGSYHHLRAECRGDHLICSFDGRKLFTVSDDTYKTGRTGVRTCTGSRFYGVTVTTSEEGYTSYIRSKKEYEREVACEREKYPQMELWRTIDTRPFGGGTVETADVMGAGEDELLLMQDPEEGERKNPHVKFLELSGELKREVELAGLKSLRYGRRSVLQDIDGDGIQELVAADDGRLKIIDMETGEIQREAPLPESGPFLGKRGAQLHDAILHPLRALYPCNLRGRGMRDFILRDGLPGASGWTIWAYDENLNLLWRQHATSAMYGMYIWFFDVDGDGRDEVLPGYVLYDDDGSVLWEMEGIEYIENIHDHIDHAAFGELDGNEENGPEIGIAGSDLGFLLVDGRTGKIRRRHRVGHAQGVWAANFRPERPGLEMWVGDRWDNYGLLTLYSGEGDLLHTFEPDNVSQGGPPVNWTGDGQELMLLATSPRALGLYDGYGRRVVPFPDDTPGRKEGKPHWPYAGSANPIDLTGDLRDEIMLQYGGVIKIYTQDRPAEGEKIYAPTRRRDISVPGWQESC